MLRRRSAWTWGAVAACVGIVAVTSAAAVDHVRKTHAIDRANVSEWYCIHRGVECDKRKPASIEDAWNRRERAYKAGDVALLLLACVAIAAVWRHRE